MFQGCLCQQLLYGLGKNHKESRNGIPPFRPILSAIGTPTYNLAMEYLLFAQFFQLLVQLLTI